MEAWVFSASMGNRLFPLTQAPAPPHPHHAAAGGRLKLVTCRTPIRQEYWKGVCGCTIMPSAPLPRSCLQIAHRECIGTTWAQPLCTIWHLFLVVHSMAKMLWGVIIKKKRSVHLFSTNAGAFFPSSQIFSSSGQVSPNAELAGTAGP